MVAFRSGHGHHEQMSRPVRADSGDGFQAQAGLVWWSLCASPQILLSGGFGSGHREAVVGEVGDELQVPAERLDVAGDGLDG